jgi:NAD(P)-dependent dehydrogenase (short-subunit alcohol dehydrogenase family)
VDVSSSESVKAAAGFIAEKEERIDVLINNAGVYADKDTSILKADRDHLIASFNTNSLGPVEMVQEFLPLLRKSDDARVINVSSGYGQLNGMSTELPGYCLSKFLLNGITIMLSRKLESEGIVVNSVCPGWVRTDMGGSNASRSVEQGASGIVWLADEVDHNQTSKFFRDGKELDW